MALFRGTALSLAIMMFVTFAFGLAGAQSSSHGVSVPTSAPPAATPVAVPITRAPAKPVILGVRVPLVAGKGLADALAMLKRAHLVANLQYVVDPNGAITVVTQDPRAGTIAPPQSSVTINCIVSGTVPDVRGLTVTAASRALVDDGYRIKSVKLTNDGTGDRVVRTDPKANAVFRPGGAVIVYVHGGVSAQAPSTATIPPSPGPIDATPISLVDSAFGTVRAYLNALIAGDETTARALLVDHDGPLKEEAILDKGATITSLRTPDASRSFQVNVALTSNAGNYFLTFSLITQNGRLLIAQHDYIKGS